MFTLVFTGAATTITFLRNNGIGLSQFMVGVAGLGGSLLLAKIGYSRHQRATNKILTSLLSVSNIEMSKIRGYYPRGSVGRQGSTVKQLNLFAAGKSVALIGDNRSGKTTFIAHHILYEMFPWWYRTIFPPRGLFLCGSQEALTLNNWLKGEIATTDRENPMASILDLVTSRYTEQRFRLALNKFFDGKLPRLLKPQPTIIIVDQAEELLRRFRGDFLTTFYRLIKKGRDNDAFRLVLIINSENAVNALKLLNGGNMFDVVAAPKVSKDAVSAICGKEFSQIFEDCGDCIGIAMDFEASKDETMSAKDFALMKKTMYIRDNCLTEPISREEYHLKTDGVIPRMQNPETSKEH